MRMRWIWLALGAVVLLALAACGAASSPGTTITVPTATSAAGTTPEATVAPGVTPTAQATPGTASYAALYSRVDYPLQIPVGSADTVTLTLSVNSAILSTAPATGQGVTTVGAPISLPTDLRDYQDIGAQAQAVPSAGTAPVVWQLTSAQRQSLLTPTDASGARQYRDAVTFTWHVSAQSAGQNTANIVLTVYYVYLDGSEHDGTVEVTSAPVPLLAVRPTPLNTTLPSVKLPLAGLSGLAGIVAALRFLWGIFKQIDDTISPVRDAVSAAATVRSRMSSHDAGQQKREKLQ